MLSIILDLFPRDTAEYGQLNEIFDRLEHTREGPITYLILLQLKQLLAHGRSIDFFPGHVQIGGTTIPDTWEVWSSTINKSIAQYEYLNLLEVCSQFVHSPHRSTGSRPADLLLYPDPADLSGRNSSNIQGIKLIFLALLMLPRSKTARLDIKKTAIHFKSGIGLTEIFPRLPLDFATGTSFQSLIDLSEQLIKNKYRKHSSFRKFLATLRDSLIVLNGYELGAAGNRPRRSPQPGTPPRQRKSKIKTKIVQLTPFHSPVESDDEPYIGDLTGITPEEGEEALIGLIEAPNDTPDNDDIPERTSAATSQVKSKYWIQTYNGALPWNSRGINPFTRQILVDWVKSNDTIASLTLGLMLCTGRKIEGVLEFKLGENADLTVDGEYIRHYVPPDNSFTPSPEQEALLEHVDPIVRLQLPNIIKDRFCARCNISDYGKTLAETWEVKIEAVKQGTQNTIKKLIRQGANGLAIDRVPLALHKKVAELTRDDALGYILAGRENDMPPVSVYYAGFTHEQIESVYRQAVEDLYR